MEEPGYWERLNKRRLSRRRLLVGAAGVGAGLAVASLISCGGGKEGPAGPSGSSAATATPFPFGVPDTREPATSRGGTYRYYSFDPAPLDSFDPHQTQFGPIYNMHSAVFSKLLRYEDVYQGVIVPDLAETMPETPDRLTYVVKIRPDVRFHDTEKVRQSFPQVAGRQLTADDVKYSIERQINKESPRSRLYYRASQWEVVDKTEVVDNLTLRITTKKPTAPFVHYLADTNAFIIAQELVDSAKDDMNSLDKMVGTGPFILDKFIGLQVVKCVRNPDWFAKDDLADAGLPDRPIIDAYETAWTPQDDTAIELAFRSKQVDWTGSYYDYTNADRVAADTGSWAEYSPTSGWLNSRILVADSDAAQSPLKDLRLRQAISMAVDRNRIGEQLFRGFFTLGSPVCQAIQRWALPIEELTKKPGYRFTQQEREEDQAEARRLWEAAGGPGIAAFTVPYAGVPEYIKSFWPQFERTLADALGLTVKGRLDSTGTEIAQGWLQKRLVFTLAFDNGWIDLDDWLYPYFHTGGSKNSFNLSDAHLDEMLERQREEFDLGERRQLGYEIQRYLLDSVAARLDWVAPVDRTTLWTYVKNFKSTPWFGNHFHLANLWLDQSDPNYGGRPA